MRGSCAPSRYALPFYRMGISCGTGGYFLEVTNRDYRVIPTSSVLLAMTVELLSLLRLLAFAVVFNKAPGEAVTPQNKVGRQDGRPDFSGIND